MILLVKCLFHVRSASDHPRGSLSSNWPLTLRVATLEKKTTRPKQWPQHNRFASHLEAFKGCKWISIHFPVYKKQVVLNDLLNCWTISTNALDFPPLPERLCVLGGRAARPGRFHSGWGGPGCHFPEWCVVLGAAWGSSQSSAGGRPSQHGAGCLFSKSLYLRLLVRLMLGEFC